MDCNLFKRGLFVSLRRTWFKSGGREVEELVRNYFLGRLWDAKCSRFSYLIQTTVLNGGETKQRGFSSNATAFCFHSLALGGAWGFIIVGSLSVFQNRHRVIFNASKSHTNAHQAFGAEVRVRGRRRFAEQTKARCYFRPPRFKEDSFFFFLFFCNAAARAGDDLSGSPARERTIKSPRSRGPQCSASCCLAEIKDAAEHKRVLVEACCGKSRGLSAPCKHSHRDAAYANEQPVLGAILIARHRPILPFRDFCFSDSSLPHTA